MAFNRITFGSVLGAVIVLVGGGMLFSVGGDGLRSVNELCSSLFSSGYMSHGHCYLWQPSLVWLHVGSDALIALSYFSIPVTLLVFISKKKEALFRSVVILFGLFICFCGLTHLLAVYNVWNGAYWFSGTVKASTAVISVLTAIFLIRTLPTALSIPLPAEYNRLATELGVESQGRAAAEKRLRDRIEMQTQQLWQSDSRWRLLTEFIYSGVWVTDVDGSISQPLPSWEAFTGQTFNEYRGLGWTNAVLPSDRAAVLEHWNRCVREEAPYEVEMQIWNANRNRYVPVISKGLPMRDKKGVVHEWLGAIYDISAIKKQEDALASTTRRLKAKNEQLEEFTYVASHDLREPLRKVQAYGGLLQEDFGADLPEEAVRYIDVMKNAASRMSTLLDEMLEYSQVSSAELRISSFDLGVLVERVLDDLEVALKDSGATVTVGTMRRVDADASQLEHVFLNLIGNAIKYRAADRQLLISIEAEILSTEDLNRRHGCGAGGDRDWVVVQVRDNGIGFDQKYAEKILKAFQRLHGRDAYEGTGMGLAICNRIIERHNGFLKADSVEGKGSTFTVALPLIELP